MVTLGLFAVLAVVAATPLPAAPACAAATGFTGTICAPASAGRHPGILLLGGDEGGNSMASLAKEYAGNGYVAASVAYFGLPGLPRVLQDVPLETVGNALAVIKTRADVDPERIAIYGISKGGEFALLAASTYPDIHAVIADVPSPFAWEGIPDGPGGTRTSSWTRDGKPVPYVPYTDAMGETFASAFAMHMPLDLRPGYDAAMTNQSAIDKAFFSLEKINGPILFLSASDDRIWNSAAQTRMGLTYLKKMNHRFADESKEYAAAGHSFIFATAAHPLTDAPFAGGITIRLGGTPEANVQASADAQPRITTFLEKALNARRV